MSEHIDEDHDEHQDHPPREAATTPSAPATPGRVDMITAAEDGARGGGSTLPFFAEIQRAFGRHDISNIRAHVGAEAARATAAVGANALTRGDHVVFGQAPSLHTAAHEAAHVVQQRAGHSPPGGFGTPGDALERHAEEVADRVVGGQSAVELLDRVAPGPSVGSAPPRAVQLEKGLPIGTTVRVEGEREPGEIKKLEGRAFYLVAFKDGREVPFPEAKVTTWLGELPPTKTSGPPRKFVVPKPQNSEPETKPSKPQVTSTKHWQIDMQITPRTNTPEPERSTSKEERDTSHKTEPSRTPQPSLFSIGDHVLVAGSEYGRRCTVKGVVGKMGYMVEVPGVAKQPPVTSFYPTNAVTPYQDIGMKDMHALTALPTFQVGAKVLCPLLGPGEFVVARHLRDDETKYEVRDPGQQLVTVERWKLLPGEWKPKQKSDEREHKLFTDEYADEHLKDDINRYNTLGTPGDWKGKIGVAPGKTLTDIGYEAQKFDDTARIDVSSQCTNESVVIDFTVSSNPSYMCERLYPPGTRGQRPAVQDLVPVYLEFKNDSYADVITVVEPTAQNNVYKGRVEYTWKCLAELLHIPEVDHKGDYRTAVSERDLAVKAQWIAVVASKNNQNHTSGGVNQKGGSGKIKFSTKTDTDKLRKSEETSRNTEWNMGERLSEGRDVFDKFPGIMQEGKELATTLEAESEFLVDEGGYTSTVAKMKALAGTPDYWPHLHITNMTASKPKTYEDTYYDLAGSEDHHNDRMLLQQGIVLRERHVDGDPTNTFLFAVKGAKHDNQDRSESIRLAAQVNLDRTKVLDNDGTGKVPSQDGQRSLDKLVSDTSLDNAFGRTLDHALSGRETEGGTAVKDLMGKTGHIKPALRIKSQRQKFLMNLKDGTAIDFSADRAEGYELDPDTGLEKERKGSVKDPPVVHSFEFGVGHPSLTASSTQSSPQQQDSETMVRPYHVPKDLTNDKLFVKTDYKQFQKLRDDVISKVLDQKKESLTKGGNKAQVLARALKMID